MSLGRRTLHRILGGEVEPGLGPLLLALGLSVTAMYMFWTFFALWALTELEMTKTGVGLAYLGAALCGMTGGFIGGALSDRFGRRPVVLVAGGAQVALASVLVVPGISTTVAVAVLIMYGFAQPARGAAQMALIADIVPPERRPHAFGTFRVTFNAAALVGPLLAAALVSLSWTLVHAGVVFVLVLSLLSATRLPAGARPATGTERGRMGRLFLAPAFATLFVAGVLASVTYNAFETLLPVSLTQEHGYGPAGWGLLFAVNPVLVLLLQLRVTRWSEPLAPSLRLALAMVLMGGSFLLLLVTAAPLALVVMLVVFVVGEMLWAPNADTLVARVAPVASRGAFMGALGISTWVGGALAPALGLRVADVAGDGFMWASIAGVSVIAAVAFCVAERAARPARETVTASASA